MAKRSLQVMFCERSESPEACEYLYTLLGGHPELTASIPKVAPFLGPQKRGKGVGGLPS